MEKYLPYIPVISAFIFLSLFIFIRKRHFIKNANRAMGVVKNIGAGSLSAGAEGTYFQNIEFQTEQGKEITITSFMGSSSYKNSKGASVTVLYDSANPEKGVIKDFANLWGFEFILFVISAGIIGVILSGI